MEFPSQSPSVPTPPTLFASQGFVVLREIVTSMQLRSLAIECDLALSQLLQNSPAEDTLEALSCAVDLFEQVNLPDTHDARVNRQTYMAVRRSQVSDLSQIHSGQVEQVVFEVLPRAVSEVTGWETVYLFNEHYVVKPAFSDIQFKWHTDSNEQLAMCIYAHVDYVSVWCSLEPLTDATNGGLIVMPRSVHSNNSQPPDESCLTHQVELTVSGGCAVIFSSNTWHRSGPNQSSTARKVFYAQYTPRPIVDEHGSPLCFAIPCATLTVEAETSQLS